MSVTTLLHAVGANPKLSASGAGVCDDKSLQVGVVSQLGAAWCLTAISKETFTTDLLTGVL